ncbi:MAG: PAS domain S-box protein [Planctomycetaceae bacterium]|nr:PAS domain S-box protein [Planctomycetaceae bacterium]
MTADRSASATKSAAPLRAVVGIGSSGGGIEAMEQLFAALPNDLGAAFVVVQHIGGDASEVQADVIARFSPYPVRRLTEAAIEPEANHVYVVPPQSEVRFNEGLAVVEELDLRRRAAVIDRTFQALAEIEGHSVVGIVLSGTGSDGTLGLKAISDRGGLTLAQTPETSKYEGMPLSAADSGHADYVLPPQRMAEELLAYLDHLSSRNAKSDEETQHNSIESVLPRICDVLLEVTEHDFRHYKSKTLIRRVSRRMQILREKSADDYFKRLQQDREEVHALFRELLISVTAFFRDSDTFSALANLVIPQLFEQRKEDQPIRMWVPGCATGQEAYTLAMLMREELDKHSGDVEVQIFATDIDERALNVARAGTYPASISNELTEHRLERFFKRAGKQLTVVKEIRDMCIFSTHNLISDPPYSQMDLISCRNLLIYLGQHLQQKLIPLFHFVLKPNGYLLLGPSENLSSHSEIFRAIDKKHRISQRKPGPVRSQELFTGRSPLRSLAPPSVTHDVVPTDVHGVAQRIVLDEFAPRYAVVNEDAHLICTSTGLERYFEFPHGPFMNNVVKMAKTGLRSGLRAALSESRESVETVKRDDLTLRDGDSTIRVELTVQPMPQLGDDGNLFMLVFHELGPSDHRTGTLASGLESDAEAMIDHLEQELDRTRNDLENAVQDLESSNEELKSSNEELRSINEELQSTNEELETSKEEIQAGNEALAKSNSDLENLLQSTRIATIFLDDDLRIRSFTPAATKIYGLIDTDVGRPLEQLHPLTVNMPRLPDPEGVRIEDPAEDAVCTQSGEWYIRRVLPYRTADGERDGLVVTFSDVTDLRQSEELLRRSLEVAEMDAFEVDFTTSQVIRSGPLLKEFDLSGMSDPEDYFSRVHAEDRESLRAAFYGCTPERPSYSCTYRLRTREGRYRWLRDEATTHFDEQGIPRRVVGSARDVHNEVRAQRRLEHRERQLRTISDATPALIAYLDTEQRYRFVNRSYAEQFEREIDDIVGLTSQELLGPENYADVRPYLTRALQGERVVFELTLRLPAQEEPLIKEVTYVPDVGEHGVIEGCHVLKIDITQRKRWERELADRESHLRRVIDHTVGFIGVLDADGTLLEANQTALTAGGLTREDVIGKPFWECYWWSYDTEVVKQLKDSIRRAVQGEEIRHDVMVRMAGDTRIMIDFMLAPVRDANGRVTYLIPSGTDITERVQTRQDLLDANARLELSLRASQSAAWSWNIKTNDVIADEHLKRLFGIESGDEADLETFLSRIDEADRDRVNTAIDQAIATRGAFEQEYRVHYPNGETRWLRGRGQTVQADDGSLRDFFGIATDITDRKRRELELADREAHLRRVINHQLGLVGVIGPDGNLLEVDARSLAIAQVTREEVIGKPFAEAPWWTYDPEVAEQIRDAMQRAFDGETVRYDVSLFAHGDEGVMIDFMLSPVIDDSGTVEYLIPSGVDITERKQAEDRIQESESRFRSMTNGLPLIVWAHDEEGQLRFVNQTYLDFFGVDESDVLGSQWHDLVHNEDVEAYTKEFQACVKDRRVFHASVRTRRADGEWRWLESWGQPRLSESGQYLGFIGASADITEQRHLEESLRASEARAREASIAKSEFLANMSHEIRTPMTSVMGYTDILVAEEKDPQKAEYLQTIKRNGRFLLDIIDDILDLSKIEAGKLEVTNELVNLVEVIRDIQSLMQVRVDERQLDFHVEFDGLVPSIVETDPKRLRQILINLLGNAIKFTETGSVRLVTRYLLDADQPQLQFDVIDTGVGISDEHAAELFQPFVQADASITRNYGGTGLGLTISRRLAHLLGGEVTVESELARGSTFTVRIAANSVSGELVEPSMETSETGDVFDPTEHSVQGTVLVVDDRRDVRFLARLLLTEAGLTVEMAEDGLEAIEMVEQRQTPFDLILLDMRMPRLDGYSTAARLRELGVEQPIIALTADALEDDQQHCLDQGCNEVLRKPIEPRQFLKTVSKWLKNGPDPSSQQSSDRHRVLVIDDSQDACRLTKLLLESEGYQVEVAHRCEQAVHLAKGFLPHTILLDHGLPDADGFETLTQLRGIPDLADSRFIAVTGRSEPQESLDAGFDEHLTKPTDLDELLRAIRGEA